MTKEEIENYFVESAGYGRDKVRNFMDIVNKALKQKSKRIEELEKENAELKGLVNQYKASKCSGISLVNRNMIMADQLTKAKELLKQWVQYGHVNELLEQATLSFINSEVEKC